MWRYIKDKKYSGYSVQKLKRFLLWEWWSNEFLCGSEEEAKKLVKTLKN